MERSPMLGLDQFGPYLIAAYGFTVVGLASYVLYLRSRLNGSRRRRAHSGRNVTTAAPNATTAQAARSANGPSTP
jgi:CcmD family protein